MFTCQTFSIGYTLFIPPNFEKEMGGGGGGLDYCFRPKWPKLASLAQKICTHWFRFFDAFFASKGYPFSKHICPSSRLLVTLYYSITMGTLHARVLKFHMLIPHKNTGLLFFILPIRQYF